MINISSFEKAVSSLEEIVSIYKNDKSAIVRDAMIKRFEYTYELAFKNLARYIKNIKSSSDTMLSFNQIIRYACDYGMTKRELLEWKLFKEKRNLTVHTYNEETADNIATIIPDFLDEATFILKKIKEKDEQND